MLRKRIVTGNDGHNTTMMKITAESAGFNTLKPDNPGVQDDRDEIAKYLGL